MWLIRDKFDELVILNEMPIKKDGDWILNENNIKIKDCLIITDIDIIKKYSYLRFDDKPVSIDINSLYKEPMHFYLNKDTYTNEYYNIIKYHSFSTYLIIHWENDLSGKMLVGEAYIDSPDALDLIWNDSFKSAYKK